MNKFLLFLLIIIITCGVGVISCPKYEDHHSTIKQEINQVINNKVSSYCEENSDEESFMALFASSICSKTTEYLIDNKLYVDNYFVFSVGKINIDGEERILSIGAFNHVFTQIKEQVNEYLSKLEAENNTESEKEVTKKKQPKKNTQKKNTKKKTPTQSQHKEDTEDNEVIEESAPIFSTSHSYDLKNTENDDTEKEIKEEKVEKHEPVFTAVEQMPQFPGGDAALMKFLSNNINYPPTAMKNGIEGRIIAQFVVTKNGSIGEVKIIRSVDPELDKEAIRLCKSLPKFTPGRMNGKAVSVWYTLPITFKIQSSNY